MLAGAVTGGRGSGMRSEKLGGRRYEEPKCCGVPKHDITAIFLRYVRMRGALRARSEEVKSEKCGDDFTPG
jgi:hypothetical protein